MQNQDDKALAEFFDAARHKQHVLPEHARRRMLLDAEALQPAPKTSRPKPGFSLSSVFKLMPTGAALASLTLGVFLGAWQPDTITALAGIDVEFDEANSLFGAGFETVFEESDLDE